MNIPRFTSIYLKEDIFKEYSYESNNKEFINNLLQLNIFIGMNNSGKSRFIRKIFSHEDLKFWIDEINIPELNEQIQRLKKEYEIARISGQSKYFGDEEYPVAKLELYEYLNKHVDFRPLFSVLKKLIHDLRDSSYPSNSAQQKTYRVATEFHNIFKSLIPEEIGVTVMKFDSIYIPTLRGLRPIQISGISGQFDSNSDNYSDRTISDYFNSTKELAQKIYTGLSLYRDIDKYSRGSSEQRNQFKKFQKFLSETFFNNEDVELIPRHGSDVVFVKIGNYEEPIYNLGEGIQSLIILTYPLFFNQEKVLKVFIEEPEIHLHPGYQRLFIETLLKSEFKNFQYFITTHSNHFLDITLDNKNISVYTFNQLKTESEKPTFSIANVENSDTNILSLIGVRNSSVFLSNCTIWVEGITDRIYIRQYLKIIQQDNDKKFTEDTHFSFVEYGGNNITHWSFLENEDKKHPNILVDRLCGKLFLVTDNDNANFNRNGKVPKRPSKKATRYKLLKEKLNDRFYCLKCREIENLLTPSVLISIIREYEGQNSELNFSKINERKYKEEYLGRYLGKNILGLKRDYSTDSGTILNKVDFAKKAVAFIKTKDHMSNEAIELAQKLYNFIKEHNS